MDIFIENRDLVSFIFPPRKTAFRHFCLRPTFALHWTKNEKKFQQTKNFLDHWVWKGKYSQFQLPCNKLWKNWFTLTHLRQGKIFRLVDNRKSFIYFLWSSCNLHWDLAFLLVSSGQNFELYSIYFYRWNGLGVFLSEFSVPKKDQCPYESEIFEPV